MPEYERLSTEQDAVYNMPLRGNHLVTGPPGTGKSVMALWRSLLFRQAGADATLITYSRLLYQYMSAATLGERLFSTDFKLDTFYEWIDSFWRQRFGGRAPRIPGSRYDLDWESMVSIIGVANPMTDHAPNLIIDEGQDLAEQFYWIVGRVAENVNVFADENQQIGETNSDLASIQDYIDPDSVRNLNRNYRNGREIAKVAKRFYPGLGTGIPELPEGGGDEAIFTNYRTLGDTISAISRYERNHPDSTIGIFVQTQKMVKRYLSLLSDEDLVNEPQHYMREKNSPVPVVDFHAAGITVTTFMSAKGLEFDAVFIPDLHKVGSRYSDPDMPQTQMMFYVLSSRARERLEFSYYGSRTPQLCRWIEDQVRNAQSEN
jgi:hypothetical protein